MTGRLPPLPRAIERRDDGVLIEWDAAGHRWLYPARFLRLACPCAGCVDELTGRPRLDPAAVPPDIRPETLALVGAYGLRIRWSDGHDTGIYGFDRLRDLCGCPRCGGRGGLVEPRNPR
ncbi:MAG TPA: DUF971 domain-containing protein [Gemmatimonadales bacterium]|nr:DUF971 domain-containing protein [Gemmatimonadales bacterium]